MILVERDYVQGDCKERKLIALFGAGLIGRSILATIVKRGGWRANELPFTWKSKDRQLDELEAIERVILAPQSGAAASQIDVVWAAGTSGFGSSQEQLAPELSAFQEVLAFSERLGAGPARLSFHLISSAGGLFEGQRRVSRASVPAPLRPYGLAKIRQEALLTNAFAAMRKVIYRPSTVYGFSGGSFRVGLVNALLQNSIRHRPSNIYGDAHTIRDYVLASDIGKFVGNQVCDDDGKSQTFSLVSGKPTTIFEILTRIEKILGRKILYQFDAIKTNAIDTSFSPSLFPKFWHPTDLETGLRQTAKQIAASSLMCTL